MASHKNRVLWDVRQLRQRGWTEDLMRTLLPRPGYMPYRNGEIRVWGREDVLAGERDSRFQDFQARHRREEESARPESPAALLLERAWNEAERDDSLASLLALRYHEALLERLESQKRETGLRFTQIQAWLQQFLSLRQRCIERELPVHWKNFLRCHTWLQSSRSPLAGEVIRSYPEVLLAVARQVSGDFRASQPEADLKAMLTRENFPGSQLLREGLASVWAVWYVPTAIRTSLSLLVALNPKDEYPEARAMRRHFVVHLGGTNTGKTYEGFQRLIRAETGVYLAPLRLLALEAQETLLDADIRCSLSTGEEEDFQEGDTHMAATAEKLDLKQRYDVAVIDECQMIADRQRGYAWTRAILGVQAPEVHLCAAPETRPLLLRLIESCGDTSEVIIHQRKTPLVCMSRTVDYERVQPGDALITFSKVGVLSVAEDLRQNGKEPAIIYGALPYSTRRRQMEGFLNGDMQYVVSTDAIGMGLNLPIRRIIFMETEKFDGVERRELKAEEIKQIAGRAGRYGMYSKGYVGATQNLAAIRAGLDAVVPPLQHAVVGFSDLVLQVDFDLLEVLTEWNRMPTVEPYIKLDISRYISLISKMREMGFLLSKEQELRAANIPFDETEDPLRDLFFQYLQRWQQGLAIEPPALPEGERTLPALEQHYRKLDLYFSFCRTFDCPIDEDRLYDSREAVADEINEILLHRLRNNIRFCDQCGKPLPLHHHGRLCDACFLRNRRASSSRPHWTRKH